MLEEVRPLLDGHEYVATSGDLIAAHEHPHGIFNKSDQT
jgi:hypothetical protein